MAVGLLFFFFFQAEDGIRDHCVTGVQTCALPISASPCPCLRPCPSPFPWAVPWLSPRAGDRKSTRLNSSHTVLSYAVFCLKKKKRKPPPQQPLTATYVTQVVSSRW